jgi:L-threonylcarbamoyladenylate synthase
VTSQRLTTRVLAIDPISPSARVLDEAAEILLRGGLVAFATETVYGLGAVASDVDAVERIFSAKGRPGQNPLIVHVADPVQARQCATEWPPQAELLARRFWPGPLTLVLSRAPAIPDLVTAGRQTVGVRVPASKVALGLIERSGKPLAAPSANRSNRISPTRAEHVMESLGGHIDLILDSGPTRIGLESTVLDLTTAPPRILRPGPISKRELEEVLGGEAVAELSALVSPDPPSSPGQLPVHYAPRTSSFRVDSLEELTRVACLDDKVLLVIGKHQGAIAVPAAHRFALETPDEADRSLYHVMHQCDALGVASIVVVMPRDEPEWQAVRDRLTRATRPLAEFEEP